MKQITEDYVSYETAVLLKEKGFPQSEYANTLPYYTQNKNLYFGDINTVRQRFYNEAIAPSQSIALKWLREVHKIHIDVFIGSDESYDADGVMVDEWHFWTYYITNTSGDMIYDAYNEVDVIEYQTHEEAVEAALLYVLKNLI